MGPRPEVRRWRFSAVLGKKVAQGGKKGGRGHSSAMGLLKIPCVCASPEDSARRTLGGSVSEKVPLEMHTRGRLECLRKADVKALCPP